MPEATYTFAAVAKILEIAESKLRYWAQVGFVGPSVRESGRMLFSFQDLISVKAAKELVDRGFAVAHIRKALSSVRASLPHVDRPLDRIRVAFDGETLVLVDEGAAFELSGQKVFDFGLGDLAVRAAVGAFEPPRRAGQGGASASAHRHEGQTGAGTGAASPPATAYEWFTEAIRIEGDPARLEEAEVCYRRALTLDPALAAAHNNLGQIAYRRGDTRAARAAFDNALALDPDQPEARFNLANLILEAGDIELAVAELKRALQVAPDFADAHYNLAVALERLGGQAQARAHLERYLALDGEAGAPWASQARILIERLSE